MVEIYEKRGLSREDAETVITTMAKYPEFFVDTMMRDELGMDLPGEAIRRLHPRVVYAKSERLEHCCLGPPLHLCVCR